MLHQFAALFKNPDSANSSEGSDSSYSCVIIYRSGNDFPLGLMTVLFSGELVSLSNNADVPSGGAWWIKRGGSVCHSFLPLAPAMGRKSHFFQRNHRASESVE